MNPNVFRLRPTALLSKLAFGCLLVLSLLLCPDPAGAQIEDIPAGDGIDQLIVGENRLFTKSDCSRAASGRSQIYRRAFDGSQFFAFYDPLQPLCSSVLAIRTRVAVDQEHAYWVAGNGGVKRVELGQAYYFAHLSAATIATSASPELLSRNGQVALSDNYFFWTEEQTEFRDRSIIYRVEKQPGASPAFVASHASDDQAWVIGMHVVADDWLIYLLSDRRLIETQRVPVGGTPPFLIYAWQRTATVTSNATAMRVTGNRLWWTDRSADGRTTSFRSASLTNLASRTTHFASTALGVHEVKEFATDGTNAVFYQALTGVSSGPLMRKHLTNAVAPVELAPLPYALTDLHVTANHVFWRKDFQFISRLPINAAAITRDLVPTGLEVVQAIQNHNNENPLVMGKQTFVRLYGRIAASSAGEAAIHLPGGAVLHGEVAGVPLPGSPLLPYRDARLYVTPANRRELGDSFWFQLPEEWTRRGQIQLRGVLNPSRVVTETNYANNSWTFTADFIRQAEICMVMKPTLTTAGVIREYEPSMQATFDYIEALLPVSELRVVWSGGLIEEPWDPFHVVGDGGPFELTNTDQDAGEMLTELTFRKGFTTRRYSEPPSGHGFDHYVAMLRPQANPPSWSGIARLGDAPSAFFHYTSQNSIGVPEGAATQCQEIAHNHGREHVDCNNPDFVDYGYPYAPNTLSSPEAGYIGFNPFTRRLVLPEVGKDFMSYCGPKWVSDYTWKGLVNQIGDIPEGAGAGAADSGGVIAASVPSYRRVVLALDFNDRSNTNFAPPSFASFVMGTADGAGIQTNAVTRTFGDLSATLRGVGADLGYDDRVRVTPGTSGTFTETALLRDFVFSREATGNGGLDLRVQGLKPSHSYRVRLWSFDSVSIGRRVSDWSANGMPMVADYAFDGRIAPTSNEQYQMVFDAVSDAAGVLVVSGRRDNGSTNELGQPSFGVFLNALELSEAVVMPTGSSFISGVLDHHGDAAFRQVMPVNGAAELAAVQALIGGKAPERYYEIRALNGGTVIGEYPVYFSEAASDEGGESNTNFLTLVSLPAGTDRLQLVRRIGSVEVLGIIYGGIQRPTVSIQSPTVGQVFSRAANLTMAWTGSDPDGHALAYTVRYSPDNRATWQVLLSSTPVTQYALPFSGIPGGSNAWLEVIASDGILSRSAQVGPFIVPMSAPTAYAFVETVRGKNCRPMPRTYVRAGESVTMHGEAFDAEDGELAGSRMSWSVFASPGSGLPIRTGTGRQFGIHDLAPGDYVVLLTARDSDSQSASSQVNLTVDPRFVELGVGGVNLDGYADDLGYLADTQPLSIRYASGDVATVRMVYAAPNFYIVASGLRAGNDATTAFSVLMDINSSSGTILGNGDLKFEVFADGGHQTWIVNGGSYVAGPDAMTSAVRTHGAWWTAELKIDGATLGGWNSQRIKMAFAHERIDVTGETNRNWPASALLTRPSTHGNTVLGPDPNDPTDIDEDGLPDRYELSLFGDIKAEPFGDADADGLNNEDEWTAGTNPQDPASNLRVYFLTGSPERTLAWTTQPDRFYNVLASDDLVNWRIAGSNVSGGRWPVPDGASEQFFRVKVCHGR